MDEQTNDTLQTLIHLLAFGMPPTGLPTMLSAASKQRMSAMDVAALGPEQVTQWARESGLLTPPKSVSATEIMTFPTLTQNEIAALREWTTNETMMRHLYIWVLAGIANNYTPHKPTQAVRAEIHEVISSVLEDIFGKLEAYRQSELSGTQS